MISGQRDAARTVCHRVSPQHQHLVFAYLGHTQATLRSARVWPGPLAVSADQAAPPPPTVSRASGGEGDGRPSGRRRAGRHRDGIGRAAAAADRDAKVAACPSRSTAGCCPHNGGLSGTTSGEAGCPPDLPRAPLPERAAHPRYAGLQDLGDVPSHVAAEIGHFFDIYKELELGKDTDVRGWQGRATAIEVIEAAFQRAGNVPAPIGAGKPA